MNELELSMVAIPRITCLLKQFSHPQVSISECVEEENVYYVENEILFIQKNGCLSFWQ
jgi:predicted ribosome-associated RNA-binding protein Tma20